MQSGKRAKAEKQLDDSARENRALREIPLKHDLGLLFPVFFLVGIGIIMVYSASSALATKKFGTDYYFLKRQAFFSILGLISLVACRHASLNLLRRLAYPLLALAVILLAAVFLPGVGCTVGGASRWLRFGGFSFQPVECARFALVIFLAYSMSKKGAQLKNFSIGFLPHAVVLGILCLLVFLQPDFGSIMIFGAITWIMLFVGGGRLLHLASSLLIIVPAGYYVMISAPYRLKRLLAFLDPWAYPAEEGYQVIHSLMGFGSGGIWGAGIGKGYQKLFYLPEPHTDFIFSVIGEELGLVGVLVIIGLYGVILWRGAAIAKAARDEFTAFVAIGLTAAIGLQVFVNMGVSLGILPTKGLTLPFLSYGGTSLVVNMASIGILMNIAAARPR